MNNFKKDTILKNRFYCDCGGANYETYKYNCKHKCHPDEDVMFSKDELENILEMQKKERKRIEIDNHFRRTFRCN